MKTAMFGTTDNLSSSAYHNQNHNDSDSVTTLGDEDKSICSSICHSERLLMSPSSPPKQNHSKKTLKRKKENEQVKFVGRKKMKDTSFNFGPSSSNEKEQVASMIASNTSGAAHSPTSNKNHFTITAAVAKNYSGPSASANTAIVKQINRSPLSSSAASQLKKVTPANDPSKTKKSTFHAEISPATKTLNELVGMDATTGGDLRFDFSQLSQLTYDENESDTCNDDENIHCKVNNIDHYYKHAKNEDKTEKKGTSKMRKVPIDLFKKEFEPTETGTTHLKRNPITPTNNHAALSKIKHFSYESRKNSITTPKSTNKKKNDSISQDLNSSSSSSTVTQTPNQLRNVDKLDDLRYDLSQLSQLPLNDKKYDLYDNYNKVGSSKNKNSKKNDKKQKETSKDSYLNYGNDSTNKIDNHSSKPKSDQQTKTKNKEIRTDIYYKNRTIYLGKFTKDASKEKRKLANDKIRQWTKDIDEKKHPELIWVTNELERLGIRKITPYGKKRNEKRRLKDSEKREINVNVSATSMDICSLFNPCGKFLAQHFKFAVNLKYKSKCIYLGVYTKKEGEIKLKDANRFIRRICSEKKTDPPCDWMIKALERENIRKINCGDPRSKKGSDMNKDSHVMGNEFRDLRDDQYLKEMESKIEGKDENECSSRKDHKLEVIRTLDEVVAIEKEQPKIASKDSKSPRYFYHIICVPEKGSIGMFIVDKEDEKGSNCGCVVQSLRENGQAKRHGVQLNDEIFLVPEHIKSGDEVNIDNEKIVGVSSQLMKKWSQSSERPIRFLVKRLFTKSKDSKDKVCDVQDVKNTDIEFHEKSKRYKASSNITKNDINLALKDNQFPVVPFCKRCNTKNNNSNFHHYLCPLHKEFESSGAKEKLILILAGIRDKCLACQYEFESGKKFKGKHSSVCGRSKSSNMQKVVNVCGKLGLQKKDILKRKDPLSEPKRPIQKIKTKKAVTKKNVIKKIESETLNVVPVTPIVSDTLVQKRQSYEESTLPLYLTDECKPIWVSCPNPWGDRNHGEGDFVLMSPDCYKLASVTQGPMPRRFILNPFEHKNSHYLETHKSPREGCRVLQLTRDALALRSWGFEFSYHDFGGACLVTDVELFSPADAAMDVGLSKHFYDSNAVSYGLKINDMILSINGKKVGGMSELDLAVELDLCGQEINIVVATYKCSRPSYDEAYQHKKWSDIDSGRHVQWCNLGNSPRNSPILAESKKLIKSSDKVVINDETRECQVSVTTTSTCDIEMNNEDKSITVVNDVDDQYYSRKEMTDDTCTKDWYRNVSDNYDKTDTTKDSTMTSKEHDAALALLNVGNSVKEDFEHSENTKTKDQQDLSDSFFDRNCDDNKMNQLRQVIPHTSGENLDLSRKNMDQNSLSSEENTEKEWEDDENPWLGCICGKTHKKPIPVFWIQCDSCDAWYNCSARCLGFSEIEAQQKSQWQCPDCLTNIKESPIKKSVKTLNNKQTTELISEERHHVDKQRSDFSIGTIVEVSDRTWIGSNKPGGVAKIISKQVKDNEVYYDVQYILESRKEFDIESEYITINEHVVPGLCSPAGSTRSTRRREGQICV